MSLLTKYFERFYKLSDEDRDKIESVEVCIGMFGYKVMLYVIGSSIAECSFKVGTTIKYSLMFSDDRKSFTFFSSKESVILRDLHIVLDHILKKCV